MRDVVERAHKYLRDKAPDLEECLTKVTRPGPCRVFLARGVGWLSTDSVRTECLELRTAGRQRCVSCAGCRWERSFGVNRARSLTPGPVFLESGWDIRGESTKSVGQGVMRMVYVKACPPPNFV